MEKIWIPKENSNESVTHALGNSLGVDSTVAHLLAIRGIETFEEARQFFRPDLNNLYDPFVMTDMHAAVNRLSEAIHQKQNILVYGDYDVDGTTAVTLVYSFLTEMGVSCFYYIPDRYTEGYGFSLLPSTVAYATVKKSITPTVWVLMLLFVTITSRPSFPKLLRCWIPSARIVHTHIRA